MKHCPNCNVEIEQGFDLCWNCCYSFTEKQVIKPEEIEDNHKSIDCLRCNTKLLYSGNYNFHEGKRVGVFGNLFELLVNKENFDIYVCPKCGKVEFYIP